MNERKWTLRQVIASSQPELIQSWNNSSSCSELQTGKYITQVTEFIFPHFPISLPIIFMSPKSIFFCFIFPDISSIFPNHFPVSLSDFQLWMTVTSLLPLSRNVTGYCITTRRREYCIFRCRSTSLYPPSPSLLSYDRPPQLLQGPA